VLALLAAAEDWDREFVFGADVARTLFDIMTEQLPSSHTA
jgi:hypothetical protein